MLLMLSKYLTLTSCVTDVFLPAMQLAKGPHLTEGTLYGSCRKTSFSGNGGRPDGRGGTERTQLEKPPPRRSGSQAAPAILMDHSQ